MDNQEEIQYDLMKVVSLQEVILDINSENIQEVEQFITNNGFLNNKQSIKQLLFTIDSASHARSNLIPLLSNILIFSSGHIKKYFKSSEVASIFHNNHIFLTLYQHGIIDIDSIVSISRCGFATFLFFSKELKEKAPSFYHGRLQKSSIIRRCLSNENDKESNDRNSICDQETDPLTISIHNDNISEFQEILSHSNISINSKTHQSIKQANEFANDGYEPPSLIEYAAFNGSLKVFKFLWMNDAQLPANILKMAVLGGCYEIIHLLESKNIFFDESTLNSAIENHRNEIVEYIQNSMDIEFTNSSFLTSISYYNIPIFLNHIETCIEKLDVEKAIEIACEKGTLDLIFHLKKFTKNKNLIGLNLAAAKGHLDIVEYLLNDLNCNVNVKDSIGWTPLFYAVRNFQIEILIFLLSQKNINLNEIDETIYIEYLMVFLIIFNQTALHLAAEKKNLKAFEILSNDKRMNVDMVDNQNVFLFYL